MRSARGLVLLFAWVAICLAQDPIPTPTPTPTFENYFDDNPHHKTYRYSLAAALILVGLAECFFGGRFWKLSLFIAGAGLSYYCLEIALQEISQRNFKPGGIDLTFLRNINIRFPVRLGVALVFGLISFTVAKIGTFMLGIVVALLAALSLRGLLVNSNVGPEFVIPACIVVFLASIFLIRKFVMTAIIFATAFGGAFASIKGIDMYYVNNLTEKSLTKFQFSTGGWCLIGGWGALFLIGVVFQLRRFAIDKRRNRASIMAANWRDSRRNSANRTTVPDPEMNQNIPIARATPIS
eukprot:c9753_g1_i1.p1 GENE.c9753_g1_i1~~c9753_g1_i1.p1  ORF type:complete len:295 (+),score=68.35 c9753_g1_i1:53-937(+)